MAANFRMTLLQDTLSTETVRVKPCSMTVIPSSSCVLSMLASTCRLVFSRLSTSVAARIDYSASHKTQRHV